MKMKEKSFKSYCFKCGDSTPHKVKQIIMKYNRSLTLVGLCKFCGMESRKSIDFSDEDYKVFKNLSRSYLL